MDRLGNLATRCLLVLAVFLAAAVPAPALAGESIKIAVAAPLTGNVAAAGEDIKNAVAMKVAEQNAAGGIDGKRVEAVYFDDLCEPREAALVANAVANDPDIVGLVGHMCSSAHLAALPTYLREGVPVITPTATSVVISARNRDEEGRVWSFRTVYRDDAQGKFLAKYLAKIMGYRKVALFYELSDYGLGLKKSFLKQARRRGLTVVGVEAYKKGDLDFTPQLTKLRAAGPEGLCIAGVYAEAALIAGQARTLGFPVPKFGSDALDSTEYIRLSGPAAEQTYVTAPFLEDTPGSPGRRFIEAFKAQFGHDRDWMAAYAYDAAGVLLTAIAQAGPDRHKVRAALAAMRTPETGYAGITGDLFFDASGDCDKPVFVKLVRDGAFVPAPRQMDQD